MDTNSQDMNDMEVGTAEKSSEPVKYENYIIESLKLTDHYTKEYPNGMNVGVKLEAIQGTRGVHVDLVFVLDLRKASFGRGGLAMRAAVLETINRSLTKVLDDVGLSESIHNHEVLIPFGRVHLPLLESMKNHSLSLMHETRTVYVITQNVKPAIDLSWLTDTGRIIASDEFVLIRQSDTRSKLPELKKAIDGEKWQILETGVIRSWLAVLSILSLVIGLLMSITVLMSNSGSPIISTFVSAVSAIIGIWLLNSSRNLVSSFNERLAAEQEQLQLLGDASRIMKSIEENENRLKLIADLNFIISPLMATLGEAISEDNLQVMVNISCSVLDECVRLAPDVPESSSIIHQDAGLRKFVSLFNYLSGNIEETNLALAYVGLTGYVTKPITLSEAITYLTDLNNSLYDIGALRPCIKEVLDDRLNMIALKETEEEFKQEMDSDKDQVLADEIPLSESIESTCPVDDQHTSFDSPECMNEHSELHDQILHASIDNPIINEAENPKELGIEKQSIEESIVIVASDIVAGNARRANKRIKESSQLQLLNDYESSINVKEERGSAGV